MSITRAITPKQVNNIIKFFIKGNDKLEQEGKLRNAIAFFGEAGIAKTSVVVQTASELDMQCSKINLSQLDDLGDLVGYPMIEYEIEGQNNMWVEEKKLAILIKTGLRPSGKTRTGYAPPKWVTNLSGDKNILLIDDFNRANPRFSQSVMELIDRGAYYGWELPKGTTIILTGNPEDGEYNVTEQDQAQNTRFFRFDVKFDIDDWALHAELSNIDSRCINYMLRYHAEVIPHGNSDERQKGRLATNPRQWTKFFNAISIIDDFSTKENLLKIMEVGSGIVPDHVATFVTFINMKLDKLIHPKRILTASDFNSVKIEVQDVVGKIEDSSYKSEIASILSTRLTNYITKYLEKNPLTDAICERIETVGKNNLFGADLNIKMLRDLYISNKTKLRKLVVRPYYMKETAGTI